MDNIFCDFGANNLYNLVKGLPSQIEGAKRGDDIEHIHKTRVTTRRIRSSLPVFRNCIPKSNYKIWIKEIKKLTRSLSAVRDLDVKIDCLTNIARENEGNSRYQPGLRRLIVRLTQMRNKNQKTVDKTLNAFSDNKIIEDIYTVINPQIREQKLPQVYSRTLYTKSYMEISRLLRQLFNIEIHVYNPENIKELHQMRIVGKYLRYTMEIFAPIYANELKNQLNIVRTLQELLGQIHDCDVWLEFLPSFIQKEIKYTNKFYGTTMPFARIKPGLEFFHDNRKEERQKRYSEFIDNWRNWKSRRVWEELYRIIYLPVHMTKNIFPEAQLVTLSKIEYPLKLPYYDHEDFSNQD